MNIARRSLGIMAVAATLGLGASGLVPGRQDGPKGGGQAMYGLIARMTAVEGKRDELVAVLIGGAEEIPGCLSYVVAKDPADADAIWVSEVWDAKASHAASLSLPAVKAAMAKGRPIIAKFERVATTEPVGGRGLAAAKAR